jgi:hypothetical protein
MKLNPYPPPPTPDRLFYTRPQALAKAKEMGYWMLSKRIMTLAIESGEIKTRETPLSQDASQEHRKYITHEELVRWLEKDFMRLAS